jgi:alkenylglycerophosphocholine/alkenylglycerophosphoethanolamine hydrolase
VPNYLPVASRSWLTFALLAALLDWIAVGLELLPLEYLAKPATLMALIGYAWSLRQVTADPRLARWLQLGLVFSLFGDIFLMFEGERWFLAGLVSFLLGHVAYIIALLGTDDFPRQPAMLLIVLCVVSIAATLLAPVIGSLQRNEQSAMIAPVSLYVTIISTMLISAWATLLRPRWSVNAKALSVGGASLFYCSDAILGWNRFVKPLPAGRLLVIITYHLAQAALASLIAAVPANN